MGSWGRCCKCLDWALLPHTCKPGWLVWCPDEGETLEDVHPTRANSAEEAAERWAEVTDE